MEYKYETHCHSFPVSRCGRASVKSLLDFYKKKGYDGVFLTNHFLDGHIGIDPDLPYEERLRFYVSDYEEALSYGKQIGVKAFFGIESTNVTSDFLIYGLEPSWYFQHGEIMEMTLKNKLKLIRDSGGFVIQAHPFREATYINHMRVYPYDCDGIEAINACDDDKLNNLANAYADTFGLLKTAGGDNHHGKFTTRLAGIITSKPLSSEKDYIEAIKSKDIKLFKEDNEWKSLVK